jgi:maltose phosphorylase
LAAKIGNLAKAYELYLRTSRLDLDDYNHEADEGLHITSMAGTWMSVVEGMAGVRVHESGLEINPTIPEAWQSYTFRILYQTIPLEVSIDKTNVTVKNIGTSSINCTIMNNAVQIPSGELIVTNF